VSVLSLLQDVCNLRSTVGPYVARLRLYNWNNDMRPSFYLIPPFAALTRFIEPGLTWLSLLRHQLPVIILNGFPCPDRQ
jgi:hypothetical protein